MDWRSKLTDAFFLVLIVANVVDFAGFLPFPGYYSHSSYPHLIILTKNNDIRKKDIFEGDISVVEHIGRKTRNHCQVYLDGDKIEASDFGYKRITFNPKSIGSKKHELILSWTNPTSKKVKSDTTYFEYNVVL